MAWFSNFDENIVYKEPFLKNSELWEKYYNKPFDKPDIPCQLRNDSKVIRDFAKSKRKVEYDSSCLKKQVTLKELTQALKKLKKQKV